MAKLTQTPICISAGYDGDWREREAAAIEAAQAKARKAAKGDLVGEIIRFHIADGYAEYMVVKQRPLTLSHLNIGDGYQIPKAHMRGLRLADVQHLVEGERNLRALFANRS